MTRRYLKHDWVKYSTLLRIWDATRRYCTHCGAVQSYEITEEADLMTKPLGYEKSMSMGWVGPSPRYCGYRQKNGYTGGYGIAMVNGVETVQ